MARRPTLKEIRKSFGGSHEFSNSYLSTDQSRLKWSRSWTAGSGDHHLSDSDLASMRGQSYHMDRNNIIWSSLMDRWIDNVVGAGPTFRIRTGKDIKRNEALEERMVEYCENEIDIRGLMDIVSMMRTGLRTIGNGGDVGYIMTDQWALQAIEPDLIVTPKGRSRGHGIVAGVELGDLDRIKAFHVGRWTQYGYADPSSTMEIPAEYMLYVPYLKRFSQTRGVPIMAGSLDLFEAIDNYIDAVVVSAQVGACQGLVVKSEHGAALGEAMANANEETTDDNDTEYLQEMMPGRVWYLQGGESVEQVRPEQPSAEFEPFVRQITRLLGLPLGLPLELAALDFSETNYSNARAAFLQAHVNFRTWQRLLDVRFLRPFTRWILPHLAQDIGARWNEKKDRFVWQQTGWQWVDPEAQANAMQTMLDINATTLQAELGKNGMWWRDVMTQRKIEKDLEKELGLEKKEPAPAPFGGKPEEPKEKEQPDKAKKDAEPAGESKTEGPG